MGPACKLTISKASLIGWACWAALGCSPSSGSGGEPESELPEATGGGAGAPAGGAEGIGGTAGGSGGAETGGMGGLGGAAAGGTGGAGTGGDGAGGTGGEPEPEPEPVCCGCLCLDDTWSCSDDTCVDADGRAVGLAAEAGFLEIPGEDYVSEGLARTSPTHRVWYSYHPADEAPEDKPLAVFFNGGPGSSTTVLFGFNTTVWTVDPDVTGEEEIAANPHSWTRFANTLHVDAPGTGFSYVLPALDGSTPSVGIDLDREAGVFLRVILRFLARHPRLQDNPVLLVGQSYGGTRATLMLGRALHYGDLVSDASAYRDAGLHDDFVEHFAAVFPERDPEALTPAQVAEQFSHQVLIQPVVAGSSQWNLNQPDTSPCVSDYSPYQCDETYVWFDAAIAAAAERLTKPALLEQTTGVDPTTIAWMHASERSAAYGKNFGTITPTPELTELFGALEGQDSYYMPFNEAVFAYYPDGRNWRDPYIGFDFLDNVYYVKTFITDARLDMVVWSPAIPLALTAYAGWVESSVHDLEPRAGVTRPGWIAVNFLEAAFPAPTEREIRFPHYSTAGHGVSMRNPAEFLEDVVEWYSTSEPAASRVAAGESAHGTERRDTSWVRRSVRRQIRGVSPGGLARGEASADGSDFLGP